MRSLQRRFAVLIFASVLVFLIYLLISNSGHLQSARSVQEKHHSFIPPDPERNVVVHLDQGQDGNLDVTVSKVAAPSKTLPSAVSKVTGSALPVADIRAEIGLGTGRETGNKQQVGPSLLIAFG